MKIGSGYLVFFLVIIAFACFTFWKLSPGKRLREPTSIGKGIIYDVTVSYGLRGFRKKNAWYIFKVDDQLFHGSQMVNQYERWLEVGNAITIAYEEKNPDNNRIISFAKEDVSKETFLKKDKNGYSQIRLNGQLFIHKKFDKNQNQLQAQFGIFSRSSDTLLVDLIDSKQSRIFLLTRDSLGHKFLLNPENGEVFY
jgi:hypothetical protein